jgi:hypothetical protein
MENLPQEVSTEIRPTINLLQCYGLTQRTIAAAGPGPFATGGVASVVVSATAWTMLFGISATLTKTATMTALRAAVAIRYNSDATQEAALASEELGPFGATEIGTASVVWRPAEPLLLPPNTLFLARVQVLGTDATVAMVLGVDVGLLG